MLRECYGCRNSFVELYNKQCLTCVLSPALLYYLKCFYKYYAIDALHYICKNNYPFIFLTQTRFIGQRSQTSQRHFQISSTRNLHHHKGFNFGKYQVCGIRYTKMHTFENNYMRSIYNNLYLEEKLRSYIFHIFLRGIKLIY